jgi:hypothetical protein
MSHCPRAIRVARRISSSPASRPAHTSIVNPRNHDSARLPEAIPSAGRQNASFHDASRPGRGVSLFGGAFMSIPDGSRNRRRGSGAKPSSADSFFLDPGTPRAFSGISQWREIALNFSSPCATARMMRLLEFTNPTPQCKIDSVIRHR